MRHNRVHRKQLLLDARSEELLWEDNHRYKSLTSLDDSDAENVGHLAVAVGGNLFLSKGIAALANEIRGLLRLLGWREDSDGLAWDGLLCARQSPRFEECYAAGFCCGWFVPWRSWAADQHDVPDQKAGVR